MSADSIATIQRSSGAVPGPRAAAASPDSRREPSGGRGREATTGHQDRISAEPAAARQKLSTMGRLEKLADGFQTAAKTIREIGDNLGRAQGSIGAMIESLDKIIKNNPPYSLQDQGRKELLMSYVSLRQQIENLTVPRPPARLYEKTEPLWSDLFSRNDVGIATPELTATSSDAEVKSAADGLSTTAKAISGLVSAIRSSL